MDLVNSIIVTLAPNLLQTEPSSKPIYPPPMTAKDFGTLLKSKAPLEETMFFSSISIPGISVGVEPVAIKIALVLYFLLLTST